MGREEFLEKLRGSELKKDYYFVIVGNYDSDEDINENIYTIAMVRTNNKSIALSFTYTDTGLIYNIVVGNVFFYELKKILTVIDKILEE